MDNKTFKNHLVQSAMELIAIRGWMHVSTIDAAKHGQLSLARAREHFPFKSSILLHLNTRADENALETITSGEEPKEALFDLFMSRLDIFQKYRTAIISILYSLPKDPALVLLLGAANAESMRWIGQAAGIDVSTPLLGFVHVNQLVALWTQAIRIWAKDETSDMSTTMAELDKLLSKSNIFGLYSSSNKQEQSSTSDVYGMENFSENS